MSLRRPARTSQRSGKTYDRHTGTAYPGLLSCEPFSTLARNRQHSDWRCYAMTWKALISSVIVCGCILVAVQAFKDYHRFQLVPMGNFAAVVDSRTGDSWLCCGEHSTTRFSEQELTDDDMTYLSAWVLGYTDKMVMVLSNGSHYRLSRVLATVKWTDSSSDSLVIKRVIFAPSDGKGCDPLSECALVAVISSSEDAVLESVDAATGTPVIPRNWRTSP